MLGKPGYLHQGKIDEAAAVKKDLQHPPTEIHGTRQPKANEHQDQREPEYEYYMWFDNLGQKIAKEAEMRAAYEEFRSRL